MATYKLTHFKTRQTYYGGRVNCDKLRLHLNIEKEFPERAKTIQRIKTNWQVHQLKYKFFFLPSG